MTEAAEVAASGWSRELAARTEVAGSEARRANDAASVVAADGVAVATEVAAGVAVTTWARTFRRGSRAAVVAARSLARGRD